MKVKVNFPSISGYRLLAVCSSHKNKFSPEHAGTYTVHYSAYVCWYRHVYHTLLVTFAGTEMNILHVYTLLVIDCPSLFGIIHHIGVVVFRQQSPKCYSIRQSHCTPLLCIWYSTLYKIWRYSVRSI